MNRAESALQFISPIERTVWVQMGMALQSAYGDAARDIWLDWSRGADSFKESDARAVWRSFRGTGVSVATLFHEAKQNGWNDAGYQQPTRDRIEAQQRAAADRASKDFQARARAAQTAASKAKWILAQCQYEEHAYLQTKGYPRLQGLVWRPDAETNLLCIPMYVAGNLCGVQLIDKHGDKKYLSGQITSQAEYCIDAGGIGATDWWVEGYATLWCFAQTNNFHDCVLMAANLGDDADTTAAQAGQIAGAYYGENAIPPSWLGKLTMMTEIREMANRLADRDVYADTDDALNSVASANN